MTESLAISYKQGSLITQLHERIVKSIRKMPREIVNFLNINHYHGDQNKELTARSEENMQKQL